MNLDEILNRLAKGEITPQTAKKFIQLYSIVEIDNIAKIDSGRSTRKGIPEIILAEGKSSSDLIKISKKLFSNSGHVIISRVNNHQMKSLSKTFPKKFIRQSLIANMLVISKKKSKTSISGKVAIITAGTSDIPVAEESKIILEEMRCKVFTQYDVGIAGIHRLFNSLQIIIKEDVDVIIAIAGREGAMPSIIAGLVDIPVIGVPTSTGYGYGKDGIAALMSMLQSCSLGIATVNIDSGVAAGVLASLIAKRSSRTK
ncbi:MAG: hypothetical protein CMO11_03140 [Thaumarchaeota archaeon]|nr:hypothetical protein [Nitrososphaerota archaeon]|tara:strand:+ start:1879 stop:2649 length:771 start_codon:yes stop_codon:yes gene_type:complete